jgi:hypothetical protein
LSRRAAALLLIALSADGLVASGGAARAQEAGDDKVEAALENARRMWSATPPRPKCGVGDDGEIVVCGKRDDGSQKVPSSSEAEPTSPGALRDGSLHPPELGRGSCRGQPGCFIGGHVPPPIYYIDMKAIPEPPEGSDADKIAKGEMPAP